MNEPHIEPSEIVSPLTASGKSFHSLVGKTFDRLYVESFVEIRHYPSGQWSAYYRCKCQCGNFVVVSSKHLPNGHTKSCGCFNIERTAQMGKDGATHRMTGKTEFKAWQSMIQRCENPNCLHFNHYGGRGISVCRRWAESFETFLSDVGMKPPGKHSLDRYPNQNGNYEPGNVRWATDVEQGRNRRNNALVTFNGVTRCIADWADIIGVRYYIIKNRLLSGWPVERALTTPVRSSQNGNKI